MLGHIDALYQVLEKAEWGINEGCGIL